MIKLDASVLLRGHEVTFDAEDLLRQTDAAILSVLNSPAASAQQDFLPEKPFPPYIPLSSSYEAIEAPVEQDSFLIRNGKPYMPLPDAVRHTGVQRETLLNWMKNLVEFDGEPIDAIYFKPTGNHFISKASVERIAKRFIRWPSNEPASNIRLGQTEQNTGYLSTSDAARMIGIPDITLRKWVRQGGAPLNKPLDVVKDTASGYFYIQQESVLQLAKHIKEFGLARGRRAQNPSSG